MTNSASDIQLNGLGFIGRRIFWPVKTGQSIKEGTMIAQQIADGLIVPATSAGTWPAFGKATHAIASAAAGQELEVETDRTYKIANATAGDAFSEAFQLGAPAYALNDYTVQNNDAAGTLQQCGTFEGMEADGMVRVHMSPRISAAAGASLKVQRGTGTLAAGVLLVTGVTLTASSAIVCIRKTEAGTDGDEVRVPTADRTPGALGTGSFTARAFLSGAAAASDTSTFDWIIVG